MEIRPAVPVSQVPVIMQRILAMMLPETTLLNGIQKMMFWISEIHTFYSTFDGRRLFRANNKIQRTSRTYAALTRQALVAPPLI